MDVGAPSNFARMACLFGHDADTFRKMISGYSFSDEVTRECIRSVYEESGYIMDPHGAVAFCGLRSYMQESESRELNGVFLETARSEERRVGKEGGSTSRSRWTSVDDKKKKKRNTR